MTTSGWIGVDLDGTLAHYDGWKGEDHIGEPIPRMVERVKTQLALGVTVKIFTARVAFFGTSEDFALKQQRTIREWCEKHIGQRLEVTCTKDFGMIELWDDRAVQVMINTGENIIDVVQALLDEIYEFGSPVGSERMEALQDTINKLTGYKHA